MLVYDLGTATKRKKTSEGYLQVEARIARVGVQDYDAHYDFEPGELPANIEQKPGQLVRLLRPADQVFEDAALKSCVNKPITDGHPTESVTADNIRDLQVGFSKESVRRDGDKIAADLLIQAKDAIEKIEKEGITQISLGYATDVVWKDGVDDVYGAYDGVQTNIRCNHIALVKSGRAGPEVRLSDAANKTMEVKKMKTRVIDGITIEVTDQAGEALDKLNNIVIDSRAEVKTLTDQLSDAKKDVEKLTGKLDAEKAKALDVESIDKLVETRLSTIDSARKIAKDIDKIKDGKKQGFAGKSNFEIRKEAIEKHAPGKFDLINKSDEYMTAVFDTLVKSYNPQQSKDINDDLGNLEDNVTNIVADSRDRMRATRNAVGGTE